jgi:hypothetical protein
MTETLPPQYCVRRPFQRFWRDERFRLAQLPDGEDDEGRARAIRKLHRLYRLQLVRWEQVIKAIALAIRADEKGLLPYWASPPLRPPSREARAAIVDHRLDDLFNGLGERICRSNDPVAAAKKLFRPMRRRGPKVKNAERDLSIALEVQKLRLSGETREAAIFEVACTRDLDSEAVRRIVRDQDAAHGHDRIKWLARAGKTKPEELGEIQI